MKSLLILSLLALALAITYGKLDTLETKNNEVSNSICSGPNPVNLKKCLDEFKAEISSSDLKQLEFMQTRAKCCSLTRLKKCALDAIRCGDTTEQVLNEIEWTIENFKDHSKCQDHHGNFVIVYCLPGN